MAGPAPDNLKLTVASTFLPPVLRDEAAEFNRLRSLPSSPSRTQACDAVVTKVLTICMELQTPSVLVDYVVNDCLVARYDWK